MSELGLRDALQRLADQDGPIDPSEIADLLFDRPSEPAPAEHGVCNACGWEGDSEHDVCPSCGQDELNYFTKASEPAPVVTDEAVERTAAALWDEVWSAGKDYSAASDAEKDECRVSARTILEAAASPLAPRPLLDREALFQRVRQIWLDAGTEASVADDAAGHVVAEVLELARPMPTREELAAAGHRWSCLKRDEPVHELDAIDYDRADEILEIWALLSGAES